MNLSVKILKLWSFDQKLQKQNTKQFSKQRTFYYHFRSQFTNVQHSFKTRF